ncbi:MAG: hypothetical protein M1819_003828 [Sarea resinae]|nr:MAG: hypothetical protein M1819_003828 [Sarea resinae]
MRFFGASLFALAAAKAAAGAESSRPRGVGPEFAKFYKSTDAFTCISNPSIHLSVSQVNDDFCDCPDGSDEPGTSACAHLSPLSPASPADVLDRDVNTTFALPGYYCKNKGHQPSYIPFTNVNDGVCDYELCCDGSDEWQSVGGTACEDRCKAIGKEWRAKDEQRKRALSAALKKRKELVAESSRLRKEVEDRLQSLGTEIEGAEMKVAELEKELEEVERREKGKVVRVQGKASRINVLAGLAKGRIDELRENLINVRKDRDANKARLKELETILSTFKEEYNPNFNDEGVKRAVRRWEEYAARGLEADIDAAHERDLDEVTKPDGETGGIRWEDWEGEEEGDADVLYKFEEYLPHPVRNWIDQKLRDLRVLLIENGILAESSSSSAESKAVTAARSALDAARKVLSDHREGLTSHQADLDKDYGPDDIFRALKGRCVEKDSGEYTYELCWLDRTTQKPKKGGAHVGMGNFVRIDRVTVDEDIGPDGKGLGSGERIALRYENGQHCWNGPHRSTTAILGCAEKDEIWKVIEEEKCVYRLEVGTPAVCDVVASNGAAGNVRDEL